MTQLKYKCPKCGNTECEVAEIHAAGGFWSKVFDVEGQKFSTVTCSKCKYTEFFKAKSGKLGDIFDLFTT